jgi:chemotaxis protein methyltransferase CheR
MPTDISDVELAEIGAILIDSRGIDIKYRKCDCIKRRIALRMRVTHCQDFNGYCSLLKQSEQELDLLLKMLTIHVSQFFRNPSMFEKLKCELLPGIFAAAKKRLSDALQIYSLGCAGGEEPYSLAILLKEHFNLELQHTVVNIVAVDIDKHTLSAAKSGEYREDRLKNVPGQLIKRYFQPCQSGFQLNPEILEMVTFLQEDITKKMNLPAANMVVCRNTLIYFTRTAQELILNRIADLLAVDGILVLGKSETLVGDIRRRFEPVCRVERIYRKKC